MADTSGSWGCGAYTRGSLEWFQLPWPVSWENTSIAIKEMLPLVIAAAVWGRSWHGTLVRFWSDNQAVVAVLSSCTACNPQLMHLLRCLFFFQAQFGFELRAQQVPGSQNTAADALSRNRVEQFHSLLPQASPSPTQIPAALLQMLLDLSHSWTSPCWNFLLGNCLLKVSRSRQPGPMPQQSPTT